MNLKTRETIVDETSDTISKSMKMDETKVSSSRKYDSSYHRTPNQRRPPNYIRSSIHALKNPGVWLGYISSIGVSVVLTSIALFSGGELPLLLAINAGPAIILLFTIRNHYRSAKKIILKK